MLNIGPKYFNDYRLKNAVLQSYNKLHQQTRSIFQNIQEIIKLPEENFVFDVQKSPSIAYSHFYNNQFDASNNKEIVIKLIADINNRLASVHFKQEEFDPYKKSLQKIRDDGLNLLYPKKAYATGSAEKNGYTFMNVSDVYAFVFDYIETMYELLKSQNSDIQGTYYVDFAKDFLGDLCIPGKNTQLFFTFENLDEQYFIDVRPLCLYPVHLMSLPEFSAENPLIPTQDVKGYVESKLVDSREVSFHDIGHACVMSRQDTWLFETCNEKPSNLVKEWLKNKDLYIAACNNFKGINDYLCKAMKVILFDITHDRGYQFYLPILKQQFKAIKNIENLKTRINRGEFDNSCNRNIVHHLDAAKQLLLDVTDQLIVRDNLTKIEKFKNDGYIIKKYPDVESCVGVPKNVVIYKNGKISVNFDSNGKPKTTSLYEIELISLPVDEVILHEKRINNINKLINQLASNDEFIQLDIDLIDNLDSEMEENHAYKLKKIEIFKLERLLALIKLGKAVKFSLSKPPVVYESNKILVNQEKEAITIDTGLFFKLNEISIERKSKATLKYINLEPNDRFVPEVMLRDSYIKYSNSKNPHLKPYVTINDELELGIIDTKKHVELSKAVSSLLSRSIDKSKDIYGGYLPSHIVERAQVEYVSPYAISNLWGKGGYRFVLTRKINKLMREVIGTALISSSKDPLFFFTNKYNNIKLEDVDFELSVDGEHKWFDKFNMPEIEDYKPANYNQLANFAIEKINCRGLGLGELLITEIVNHYALHNLKVNIQHSQPLICGEGLFQIADPSWREYMLNIGFKLRYGAETFYLDHEWDKLPPLIINGKQIDHKTYNQMYGLPQIYENVNLDIKNTDIDLNERVDEVKNLATSGNAKLQYFQMIYPFNNNE